MLLDHTPTENHTLSPDVDGKNAIVTAETHKEFKDSTGCTGRGSASTRSVMVSGGGSTHSGPHRTAWCVVTSPV